MGKPRLVRTITDADIDRYIELSGRPRPPRAVSGSSPSWNWMMAAYVPPKEAAEKPEPLPCRVLMKGGVWLDGRPQEEKITAPESVSGVSPCGVAPELNRLPIDDDSIALPSELACAQTVVGAVKDRTPRQPGMSLSSHRHTMLKAKGLCIRCGKDRGRSGSKCYCQPCLDATTERRRELRAGK